MLQPYSCAALVLQLYSRAALTLCNPTVFAATIQPCGSANVHPLRCNGTAVQLRLSAILQLVLQLYNCTLLLTEGLLGHCAMLPQHHLRCHIHGVAALGARLLLHNGCNALQPSPAPLPISGLWACYSPVLQLLSNRISSATLTPQLLLPSWCNCALATTHCSKPAPLPIEGLRGFCTMVQLQLLQVLGSSIAFTLMLLLLRPSLFLCTLAATQCSQPLHRYQSRGYGGAAWCGYCGRSGVAAF